MSNKPSESEINFLSDKVYVHRWPMDSISWSSSFTEEIDNLNKNKEQKRILIKKSVVQINSYIFDDIKKIGVTIPLFKKEATLVFEAKIQGFSAHVHLTTLAKNYLEIFNALMSWKDIYFPSE